MTFTKSKIIIGLLIIACFGFLYCFLRHPTGYLLSVLSRSPFNRFIYYEWDISAKKDESVKAELTTAGRDLIVRISGDGKMVDFTGSEKNTAWHSLQNVTTGWYFAPDSIVIMDGVSNIGAYAFPNFSTIEELKLPVSLKTIGHGAFINCTSLSRIIYDGTIDDWKQIQLEDEWCTGTNITSVECSDGISTIIQ